MKRFYLFFLIGSFTIIANAQKAITVTIATDKAVQVINNFGASGAWYSEPVGRYWADSIKERMAESLFSKGFDASGNPLGIGLSAWRFNIGGGTMEQGVESGIDNEWRRAESFLQKDGSYDWTKQPGYLWFTRRAKTFGVENLIAFCNTPPVFFTKNGLGYKTEKDFVSNLKPSSYIDYAKFLKTALEHFEKSGLPFQYISPVNEPQWDWYSEKGKAKQEGSPWTNKEIFTITKLLDSTIARSKQSTRILIPEAAELNFLLPGQEPAGNQVKVFFDNASPFSVVEMNRVSKVIAGHSYFTDKGDSARIELRKKIAIATKAAGIGFWQTEYSMLGDGFKEGKSGAISEIDCALFLAKVIHDDLVYANAAAWQFWNSWEPGSHKENTRYYLIALKPAQDWQSGSIAITKNLWALGHYSRFIRPGMQRLFVSIDDNLSDVQRAQQLMVSAFGDSGTSRKVAVAINYSVLEKVINFKNIPLDRLPRVYITSGTPSDNLRLDNSLFKDGQMYIPARSIATIVWE